MIRRQNAARSQQHTRGAAAQDTYEEQFHNDEVRVCLLSSCCVGNMTNFVLLPCSKCLQRRDRGLAVLDLALVIEHPTWLMAFIAYWSRRMGELGMKSTEPRPVYS